MRILVVEDEPDLREYICQVLAEDDHDIVELADGREVLLHHTKEPFDLIITDMIMPGVDGVELIREIKVASPDTKIIAMSGGGRIGSATYLTLATRLGADHTLQKPFLPVDLQQAIANLRPSDA